MRVTLLIFIILFGLSCQYKKYSYESDTKIGKSYIGSFKRYDTSLSDSAILSGRVFMKRKDGLKIVNSSKVILINGTDTINTRVSYILGYDIKLAPGIYKIIVKSFDCVDLDAENVTILPNNLYLIDFYLQKGQGISKWVH